ncbi:MAG: rod shape-determining protein MreC [Acidobacteria bacterium]|nr:MAG: rod shape-determining protein MreC [Acidobacteriota bacterium]
MARVLETKRGSRFLLGGLVLAHLVVISRQVERSGGTSLLGQTVFAVLSPFQRVVGATMGAVTATWSGYFDLRHVYRENQDLRSRVASLEMELQRQQDQLREAERLREIADVKPTLPFETVVAQVIATEGVPWFHNVTLSRGRDDGVSLNAPVISTTGVVGRVVAVGPHAAKVQLLLDHESGLGVRIERSRITAVVSGQAGFADQVGNLLAMKYVPVLADVSVGDVVVTSGLDRMFPKGLMVGRVQSARSGGGLFKEILVAPSARFERLEELMVIRTRPEELAWTQEVRPPEPKPAPRATARTTPKAR